MISRESATLFAAIGGTAACRRLSKAFYARVDRDALLRPLFPGTTLKCAIEAFEAFLVQFLGGPEDDSQLRFHLSLRASHQRFGIGREHRDAWIRNMKLALADAAIDGPAREELRNFFEVAADYVIGAEDGEGRLDGEIAARWAGQRVVDQAVAAVRTGDAERAIELAGRCPRRVLPGLLGRMIESGNGALLDYVHARVGEDPALMRERYYGRTLLHAAAAAGNAATVELLLRLGADPNAIDNGGHTPLYCAGNQAGTAEAVHALVRAGAQVDAGGGVMATTPLHMAARRGNVAVARALLECGADAGARDRRGDTPLERAVKCKKREVAELLRGWR